jgi:glycosyltransferase involved in cell wall biosynthesis
LTSTATPLPGPPLRIAVLGDLEGPHTRAWLEVFVERGHDVHAISFYAPSRDIWGVKVHVLRPLRPVPVEPAGKPPREPRSAAQHLPASAARLLHAFRYWNAGLRSVVREIQPDILHAHYIVEHGFYGSFAGFRPYVVSAWGSDLLVESYKPAGKLIAQRTLTRADLLTANDASLVRRALELGLPPERSVVIHLGIERLFLDAKASVNLQPDSSPPTIISTRALEPQYNVDVLLRALARVRRQMDGARLRIAGDGSQRSALESLAQELGLHDCVTFMGHLGRYDLAQELAKVHVYVSVPASDSLALSNIEAMATGAFPVVSDLASVDGWITHGVNGLRVPTGDIEGLTAALVEALTNSGVRQNAVAPNRAKVEAEGLRLPNMLVMERHYYRLAGHPVADMGQAI